MYIIELIVSITNFLWEGPLLVLIILVGLYYATKIYHGFLYCIKKTFKTKTNRKSNLGEIPLLNCLLTAISGTIGSGILLVLRLQFQSVDQVLFFGFGLYLLSV